MNPSTAKLSNGRRWFLLALLLSVAFVLMGRTVYLQWQQGGYLEQQGKKRFETTVELDAHRGVITDRNGEPLAVSAPLDTLVVNPRRLLEHLTPQSSGELARLLDMDERTLHEKLASRISRGEYYLKRQLTPDVSAKIAAIRVPVENKQGRVKWQRLPGTKFLREYNRYYPMAEVTSQLVGFTGVDNNGLAGLELSFNEVLSGTEGEKLVVVSNNRHRDVVEELEMVAEPKDGEDLVLSIDRRVQYLAYRELKAAVQAHEARAASAVLLDAQTGEVLAMVNQPAFNPNNKAQRANAAFHRNRAVTDVFEPGSTVKPFTIAAALEAGVISPRTVVDTSPGRMRVGSNTIRDAVNYGPIDPQTILMKSSNIGASKVALSMSAEQLWKFYDRVGFGVDTESHFPGEADGRTGDYWKWHEAQQAAFSYGYGLSVTALQLARAYSVFANDGVLNPVSLLKLDKAPEGERVMSAEVARTVRKMLESVLSDKGTGKAARVKDYRIAGKTGTAHRSGKGGYDEDKFTALFAGIAPASKPRLVLVVVVHDPGRNEWHGGAVAAPVFSKIMAGALRLLNISPDDLSPAQLREAGLDFDQGPAHVAMNGGHL